MKGRNGIATMDGVNDCRWNDEGVCAVTECGPCCTYTQIGVWLCSAYVPFGLPRRPKLGSSKCEVHKRVFVCRGTRRCVDCGAIKPNKHGGEVT